MGSEGQLSVTVLKPVISGIRALGWDWKELLSACGIGPELIADSEARIPRELFHAFWPRAAEWTANPSFGLHVGHEVRARAVNLNGYLLMSSATLREGIERVIRYQRLVFGEDWMQLVDRGSMTRIRLQPSSLAFPASPVELEFRASILLRFLEWVAEADFRAGEVSFTHGQIGKLSEYDAALRCPVKFRCQENEVVVRSASLDQPSVHANPEIARIHKVYAEHHLEKTADLTTSRKARLILQSHLEGDVWDLERVARALHMSRRTLQRRLADEGSSFTTELDHLRRDLSLLELEQGEVPLAEVAYLSGFSDTSALSRAVRRWTGKTPLQYRRSTASP